MQFSKHTYQSHTVTEINRKGKSPFLLLFSSEMDLHSDENFSRLLFQAYTFSLQFQNDVFLIFFCHASVGTPSDRMCTTGPGLLRCKEIVHASFMSSPDVILEKCKKILNQCERKGYKSVAFPAVNTGL